MFPRFHECSIPDIFSPKGHHTLAYTEWGEADNPNILICVHGLTRNGRDFDFLAYSLENHYRILCPDMPGRGRSEWLTDTTQYNYATYIADSLALLDTLGITKVDWLGTSMGGLIGMFIAATAPERIRRLVINDVGPFIPGKALQRINKYVGVNPSFRTVLEVENHLRTTLAPFGITHPSHWDHIAEHSAMKRADGTLGLAYDPGIVNAFQGENGGEGFNDVDLWHIWEKITQPSLILRGEMSDILLAETALRMQQSGPNAVFVEFPRVGHAPALMEPGQIAAIKEWLIGRKP